MKENKETNTYYLGDVQYAFLLGRNSEGSLRGVSCHILLETECSALNTDKLVLAWDSLLRRHKALRACISEFGEITYIPDGGDIPSKVNIMHFEEYTYAECERKTAELRSNLESRLMDIESGELMGLTVCLLPNEKARMIFDFDCVGYDITSFQIILRDLAYIYSGRELPHLPKNFEPYSGEYKRKYTAAEKASARIYWQEKVKLVGNMPAFPLSERLPNDRKNTYSAHSRYISDEAYRGIKEFAQREKYRIEDVLLALYVETLSRETGDCRFLLNIPLMDRSHLNSDAAEAVMDNTEIMIFDADISSAYSFNDIAAKLRADLAKDTEHIAFSGIKVLKLLNADGKDVTTTFSLHISADLSDEVFRRCFGDIKYIVSQTPQVTMDSIFFSIEGKLLFMLTTPDGWFKDNTEENILDGFEKAAKALLNNDDKGRNNMLSKSTISENIKKLYAQILDKDGEIDESRTFMQLGGNSILMSKLQYEILKAYGVKVSFKELFRNGRADEVSDLIYNKLNEINEGKANE